MRRTLESESGLKWMLANLGCVDQDHPMYGEIADTIQAAFVIWSHGETAAATGCVDKAIGIASDADDLTLVDGLKRLRLDIESGPMPEDYALLE
jgi:hypothetical protein